MAEKDGDEDQAGQQQDLPGTDEQDGAAGAGNEGDGARDRDDLDLVGDDEDESAEIWDDLEREEAAAAAGDPADSGSPGDDDQGTTGGSSGDDGAADGDDAQGDTGSAGEEDDAGKPASEASEQAGSGDKPDQVDAKLLEQAPPEVRAAYEAVQAELDRVRQSESSQRGRVGAMQRQVNTLSQRINDLTKGGGGGSQGQQQKDGASGAEADASKDPTGFLKGEEWQGFATDYPEIAGPISKLIGGMQSQLADAGKKLDAIGDERLNAALDEQETRLNDAHSDWFDVISTSVNGEAVAKPEFVAWLESQPRHIREAAARNSQRIVDAAEAADVIGRFKEHIGLKPGSRQQDAGKGNDAGKKQTTGRRTRQLEAAASTRTGGPGAVSGIPEEGDPEAIWDGFEAKEQAEQRRRA